MKIIAVVDNSIANVPARDFVWPYGCHFGDEINRPIKLAEPSDIAITKAPESMAAGKEFQKKKIKQQMERQ